MFNSKLLVTAFFTLVLLPTLTYAQSAEQKGLQIAQAAKDYEKGFTDFKASMLMTLISKNGDTSTRIIRIKTLEVEGDGDKSLSIFDQPADVKGTAMLTYSHGLEPDDQWIYLPALKKVKRISSRNKSGPFMGSTFAFEDLGSQEVEKYSYRFLREEGCGAFDFGGGAHFEARGHAGVGADDFDFEGAAFETAGDFLSASTGEKEPGAFGFDGARAADDTAVDKGDAGSFHFTGDLTGAHRRDGVGIDEDALIAGLEDGVGDILCSVRRADRKDDGALLTEAGEGSGVDEASCLGALVCWRPAVFGSPVDSATGVARSGSDGDAHGAGVKDAYGGFFFHGWCGRKLRALQEEEQDAIIG